MKVYDICPKVMERGGMNWITSYRGAKEIEAIPGYISLPGARKMVNQQD